MNFVAHMVVAHRVADAPSTALLLGAAAPDLARMARVPVATTGSADHLAGVATHHRTDAVFHELSLVPGPQPPAGRATSPNGACAGDRPGARPTC